MMLRWTVLLLALLPCAAAAAESKPPRLDQQPDRILVTVPLAAERDFLLGPGGRLDYPLPADRDQALAHRQTQARLVSEFPLATEAEWPMPAIGLYCFVFSVESGQDRDAVIDALRNQPGIAGAQPMQFFSSSASDPFPVFDPDDDERLAALHRRTTGEGVRITVIDSGADLEHEDIAGASIEATDMVGDAGTTIPAESHGTAIVGLITARADNGIGIRGIAPAAEVNLLRACWEPAGSGGRAICNSFTLAKALLRAIESDTDIINMSISGPRDPLLELLTQKAADRGMLLAAAGDPDTEFPAAAPGVLAAVGIGGQPPASTDMMTLQPGNSYSLQNGSSLLAARLSGYAALLRSLEPRLGQASYRELLARTGLDTGMLTGNHTGNATTGE